MKPGKKRITIDLTDAEHRAFSRKCFLHEPSPLHMSDVVISLVRKWCGLDTTDAHAPPDREPAKKKK